MEDSRIIALYFERDESALAETQQKYRHYLHRIAHNVLHNEQDAQECVNDAYLRAWNAIPPHRPARLSTFLGKIVRHLALDRCAALTAEKRGGGTYTALLEEWRDCLPDTDGRDADDDLTVQEALNRFLRRLPADRRRIFIRRYWDGDPIREIAAAYGGSESRIKMQLSRTRQELKEFLEKESIAI